LNDYHGRGVRALFPVHKYDNAFSAGDGDKNIIELGNFIQGRHYNNFTEDCDDTVNTSFDKGDLFFPGINEPREDYFAPPPTELEGLSAFADQPVAAILPFVSALLEPVSEGDFCQNAGLTQLGEFLVEEVMSKGMILEIDHLPRRSYKRVFEILQANDYPAAGTHGLDNGGALYALGGVSIAGFSRCRDASEPGTMDDGFQQKVQRIADNGGFPAIGFGFDLNGFAGAPRPRFGASANCSDVQTDPVTYPFQSFAGDVTFHQPRVGNRTIDFNIEGMAHIGLVAELIEDVRGDGVTDEDLEPLFKSAEGYLRMWEKAEARGATLRQ
jgi:microsomal dipeptidase-like Zn-dependent dipeptidase